MKKSFGIESAADLMLLSELSEESVLRIISENKNSMELLPVLQDERIPVIKKADFQRLLLILVNKNEAKIDKWCLKYSITSKGRWRLVNSNLVNVVIALASIAAAFLIYFLSKWS